MPNERFLLQPVSTRGHAWRAANVLYWMQRFRSREMTLFQFEQDGLVPDANIARYNIEPGVDWHVMKVGADTFCFVSGITNSGQGQDIWNAYESPQGISANRDLTNFFFSLRATNIFQQGLAPLLAGGDVYLHGHSAGGAICVYLAALMRDAGLSLQGLHIQTFGAPAPANREFFRNFENCQAARFFNADDPVPLMPFMTSVAFGATWTMGARTVQRLNSFSQLGQGYEISLQGNISRQPQPRNAAVDRTASVGSWIAQQDQGLDTGHSLSVYVSRLFSGLTLPSPGPTIPSQQPVVTPPPLTTREADRFIAQQVETVVTFNRERTENVVVIPDDRLYFVKRKRPLWEVWFGPTRIVTTSNKKRARGLARQGNDFIRRLLKCEIVFADDYDQQHSQWLFLASHPDTGFVPQLQTSFPS